MFHLETLTLAKSVLSKECLPPNIKLKNILGLLTGKLMDDSGLESHQAISDVKKNTLGLKCNILCSKRRHNISPIENKLTKKYLFWEKNSLEDNF